MPILAGDVEFRFATIRLGTGNSAASTPGNSNGKFVSTTQIDGGSMNNLFPDITGDQRTSGGADYQCVFLYNRHDALTMANVRVWIYHQITGVADIAMAVDHVAATPVGSAAQQASVIADRNVAPLGVGAFTSPVTQSTGLELGAVPSGHVKAFWLRRTAIPTSGRYDDDVTLAVHFDEALAPA